LSAAHPPAVLAGKVALVTGAGVGVGREEALALAAHGARVVVNARSDGCEAVVAEIRARGGEALARRGSVADPNVAAGLVAATVEAFGRIDILVNNAGVALTRRFEDISLEEFETLFATNVSGHFHTMRAAAPLMRAQGGGRIINTASASWRSPRANLVYGATKAAVVSMTYGAAWELRDSGVTCNAICPFGMTPGVQVGIEAFAKLDGDAPPGLMDTLKDYPSPEYAAPLVVFLASDAAAEITGLVFRSGGGRVSVFSHPTETAVIRTDISDGANWTFDELARRVPAEVLGGRAPWWIEDERRG
jgi:NAD(P)-dependent dehydrogenase (short-subunit alcohol dehydrogenase family)